MLLLMGQRDPQEELNLDSKLREFFFPRPIPNLRMADKLVHFTRFSADLVPKVLNASCAILPSNPAGLYCIKIIAPYGPIYAHI